MATNTKTTEAKKSAVTADTKTTTATTATTATKAPAATTVKEEPKKAPAKKAATTATKTSSKKATVKTAVVQYQDIEFSIDECMKKAEASIKKEFKGKTIDEINIYVKPEERRIYYVVNKDKLGSVEL